MEPTLKDVIQDKLNAKLAHGKENAEAAILRLTEEGKISRDFIAPLGVNLTALQKDPVITFSGNGRVLMNVKDESFALHPHAIYQVAEKVKTHPGYVRSLADGSEWQRALAAHILNEHSLNTERNRILVRAVGHEVRGVMSDSYRRLNSVSILTAFAEEATKNGALVSDGFMDDTRIWLECVYPMVFDVVDTKNGVISVIFGASLRSSDYGDGALELRTMIIQGICTNRMVRESALRQVHLGSKLPDDMVLSDKTYALDTATTVSAVRDITGGLLSVGNIKRRIAEVELAANTETDIPLQLKSLIAKGNLTKTEGKEIEELIIRNDPEDGVQGGSTLWKLSQGITAAARDAEPRRMRELMELGGQFLGK